MGNKKLLVTKGWYVFDSDGFDKSHYYILYSPEDVYKTDKNISKKFFELNVTNENGRKEVFLDKLSTDYSSCIIDNYSELTLNISNFILNDLSKFVSEHVGKDFTFVNSEDYAIKTTRDDYLPLINLNNGNIWVKEGLFFDGKELLFRKKIKN